MKKFLLLVLTLLVPATLAAQNITGTITTNASTCTATTTACVALQVPNSTSNILFDVTGTWTATVQIEFSADNQVTWKALTATDLVTLGTQTSITANSTFATFNPGYTHVRLRASAFSSGTVSVTIRSATNSTLIGLIIGGSANALPAGGNTIGNVGIVSLPGPDSLSGSAITGCYRISTASTNSVNCKASVANFYGVIRAINTTSTLAYLRLYNLATAPTCSSATGFVESIPIPHNTGTGGGIVAAELIPTNYDTGLGFCITGGGTSTDNTNAVAGVYIKLGYK